MLSVLDIFKIGIGPSSSHTMGPLRISARFLREAQEADALHRAARIRVELQGSLALTGLGHGADRAILLGLSGVDPENIALDEAKSIECDARRKLRIVLPNGRMLPFDPSRDIELRSDVFSPVHPNSMSIEALDENGAPLFAGLYFSIGGGFILDSREAAARRQNGPAEQQDAYVFASAADLLNLCRERDCSIEDVIWRSEAQIRPHEKTEEGLHRIWRAMNACIDAGLVHEGVLPGGLGVSRRAPALWKALTGASPGNEREALLDRLNLYALAVNEENAAGGRVVTAPTNGAAGIIPALIRHYCVDEGKHALIPRFLLTAGAIGLLYKQRASISGAEMGCQGEVGVACSMAAAGLAAIWGGAPLQVAAAAEIGMEHNLGLTCDPVGGLVQIPCIERNAMGAVKAVNAARLAQNAQGAQVVSLDQVIETMRQTGRDMSRKYKETSLGGLAVNVIEC